MKREKREKREKVTVHLDAGVVAEMRAQPGSLAETIEGVWLSRFAILEVAANAPIRSNAEKRTAALRAERPVRDLSSALPHVWADDGRCQHCRRAPAVDVGSLCTVREPDDQPSTMGADMNDQRPG